jgi:ribosome-binding protein aMBF1 (putative translation factor)
LSAGVGFVGDLLTNGKAAHAPAVGGVTNGLFVASKLGADVSRARRRRRISRASLAERSGVSEATLKRLEKGDGRVALESFARAC